MSVIEETTWGRATAMALAKFGEVTVDGPEWPSFVEEVGEDDQLVAEALHRLRFRGFASFALVEHPSPPSPYVTWTRKYSATGKSLVAIEPLIDADEVTPAMQAKRDKLKPSTAVVAA